MYLSMIYQEEIVYMPKKNPVGYCCVVVFFHRFSVCQGVEALGLSTFFSLVFVSFVAVCLWDLVILELLVCPSAVSNFTSFLLKNVPQLYDQGKKTPPSRPTRLTHSNYLQ